MPRSLDGKTEIPVKECLAVAFGLVALAAVAAERYMPFQSGSYNPIVVDDLDDRGAKLRTYAEVRGDWIFTDEGLALAPGSQGLIQLSVPPGTGDWDRTLTLWLKSGGLVRTTVECSSPGQGLTKLLDATDVTGERLDLSLRCVSSPSHALILRLSSVSLQSSSTEREALAVDKIEIGHAKPGSAPPLSTLLSLGVLIYVVGFGFGAAFAQRWALAIAVSIATALACWLIGTDSTWLLARPSMLGLDWNGPLALAIAVAVGLTTTAKWTTPGKIGRLPSLALACLLGMAALSRWRQLETLIDVPLWPDTWSAYVIATTMVHPYDTNIREPLWPAIAWLFDSVVGSDPLAMRLLSEVASLLVILATYWFARDYGRSRLLGLVAACFIAAHSHLIGSSAQGHRTELLILGTVAICYFGFVERLRHSRRAWGLAVSASALLLTSIGTLSLIVPVLLWFFTDLSTAPEGAKSARDLWLREWDVPWPTSVSAGASRRCASRAHV